MKDYISEYSTEYLLHLLSGEKHSEGESIRRTVFKKWRDGIDLESLADLLQSKQFRTRHRAAYYLEEAVPRGNIIEKPAIELANDLLPQCRRAFVGYITNSGLYSDTIGTGLAECLLDFDLDVRLLAINWAVYTTDVRFAEFSRLVELGPGATENEIWRSPVLKRATRGLSIARRLRQGEGIAEIRTSTPEEDSFTFDYLQIFEKRLQRYVEKRIKLPVGSNVATTGYDDFESGPLVEYDNMGKVKGDLPNAVPAHVTDEQLDESLDRLRESLTQRRYDQMMVSQRRQRE